MGEEEIENIAWEDKAMLLIEGWTVNGLQVMATTTKIGEKCLRRDSGSANKHFLFFFHHSAYMKTSEAA